MSKVVTTPSHPLLVVLFQGLPQLPAVPKLQYTAALTLGAYADWAATSLRQGGLQELMPQLLQMLTTGDPAKPCVRHACSFGDCVSSLLVVIQGWSCSNTRMVLPSLASDTPAGTFGGLRLFSPCSDTRGSLLSSTPFQMQEWSPTEFKGRTSFSCKFLELLLVCLVRFMMCLYSCTIIVFNTSCPHQEQPQKLLSGRAWPMIIWQQRRYLSYYIDLFIIHYIRNINIIVLNIQD